MTDQVIDMFVAKLNRPLSYSIKIVARSDKIIEIHFFESNEIMLSVRDEIMLCTR